MGEFIAAVQNRFVFQTCVSRWGRFWAISDVPASSHFQLFLCRCKYHISGDRVRVEMTGGNWGRTNDPDTDMTSLAYIVKDRSWRTTACCLSGTATTTTMGSGSFLVPFLTISLPVPFHIRYTQRIHYDICCIYYIIYIIIYIYICTSPFELCNCWVFTYFSGQI